MSDISLRGIALGVLVVLCGIAASMLLSWAMLAATRAPAAGANGAVPPAIPGAVLQTTPHQSLEQFMKQKRSRLESAGPDHIPIEEAMRRLASKERH
jgi:hypothetical protein